MNNNTTTNDDLRIAESDREQEAQTAIAIFYDFVGFSSINGDPFGYEDMPPESYKSIKWASSKHNRLSENEYACLLDYYTLAYEGFTSSNDVEKFKSIESEVYLPLQTLPQYPFPHHWLKNPEKSVL